MWPAQKIWLIRGRRRRLILGLSLWIVGFGLSSGLTDSLWADEPANAQTYVAASRALENQLASLPLEQRHRVLIALSTQPEQNLGSATLNEVVDQISASDLGASERVALGQNLTRWFGNAPGSGDRLRLLAEALLRSQASASAINRKPLTPIPPALDPLAPVNNGAKEKEALRDREEAQKSRPWRENNRALEAKSGAGLPQGVAKFEESFFSATGLERPRVQSPTRLIREIPVVYGSALEVDRAGIRPPSPRQMRVRCCRWGKVLIVGRRELASFQCLSRFD